MDWLVPLTSIVAVTLLAGFWLWMFWDMTNNDRLAGNTRFYWLVAFVFVNVFAAVYYYFSEYKNR